MVPGKPFLTARGLSKRYGHVTALDSVDIDVYEGEILALVGDNGAGKSTLIKILSGVHQPDRGEIVVSEQPTRLSNPHRARELGIATVYQNLALVDLRDVAANLYLGREPLKWRWFVDRQAMAAGARKIIAGLKVNIPSISTNVGQLSGGQRQSIAIGRATSQNGRIIIMDEPTAALGVKESRKVLDLILHLKADGKGIVIVSHNMRQVFSIADRIEVLRHGRNVGIRRRAETTPDEIVKLIVGIESRLRVSAAEMSDASQSPKAQPDYGEAVLAAALARGDLADDGPVAPHQSRLRRLVGNRDIAIAAAGILLFILFPLTTRTFLTEFNLTNMVRNVSLIGIVAVGMTFLLIVGEIDLSVGSVLGFLVILFGVFTDRFQLGPWLAALLVIPIGIATGLLNGLIRVLLNIPSFIVTLAMLTGYRSLALIVSHERPISVSGEGVFFWLTGGSILGIPWLIFWMLGVMTVGAIVLGSTRYGFHAYATGGNLEAARDSGINTGRVKLIAFALTGGLVGLAAMLLFGYLHVAEPTSGTGFEFRVIGAAIVGGTALTGGFGTILGTFIGTLIIAIITGGMVLLGFSQGAADLSTGFLIIAVGIVDLFVQRTAAPSRFS